ncbi:MAG: hypothetical protein H6R07_2428 [Proteobacteria bacterium]|nr:hypothetical protein [Pseudomonadota bacterium]
MTHADRPLLRRAVIISLVLHLALVALFKSTLGGTPSNQNVPRTVTIRLTQAMPISARDSGNAHATKKESEAQSPRPAPDLRTETPLPDPAQHTESGHPVLGTVNALPYPLEGIDMSDANEKSGTPGGRAKFQIAVSKNGKVTMAVLLESTLDQKRNELLRQRIFAARFAAAMKDGKPLDAETILEISFGDVPEPEPARIQENEH